jgi:MFS family permease
MTSTLNKTLGSSAPPPAAAQMLPFYLIEAMATVGGTLMSVGIFFYMKYRFGWRMPQNFLLAAGQGVVYIPGALLAGPLAARWGNRRTLGAVYSVLTVLTGTAFLLAWRGGPRSAGGVVAALLAYTFAIGISWPILEGLVASGGPPAGIARRIGIYNIIWPAGGALAIAVEGTILDHWIGGLFLIPGFLHLLSGLILPFIAGGRKPPVAALTDTALPHPPTEGSRILDYRPAEPDLLKKRTLALWLSRTALPATYTVIYGLMPMMPSLPAVRNLSVSVQTVVASVWLMTRWLAFVILAMGSWWHTRPRTLVWAAVVMLIAFFGMTLRPTQGASPTIDLVSLIAWQAALGLAIGVIYAGSLYFGMVLSDGSTEHGGYHEALIGLGWIIGPLAGAAAQGIRPDSLWLGIAAVGAVIGASVLAVIAVNFRTARAE